VPNRDRGGARRENNAALRAAICVCVCVYIDTDNMHPVQAEQESPNVECRLCRIGIAAVRGAKTMQRFARRRAAL